jgi:hypothetical protein
VETNGQNTLNLLQFTALLAKSTAYNAEYSLAKKNCWIIARSAFGHIARSMLDKTQERHQAELQGIGEECRLQRPVG